MKTYEQYLQEIHLRETREYKDKHKGHDHSSMICVDIENSRMTFDYSVEIMGMMLKDFIKEFKIKI